jgi:hypothetical protein
VFDLKVLSTYDTVRTFVNESMVELLTTMGDVHLQAAKDALLKIKKSPNPAAHVWSATNHLEVAQISYRKTWAEAGTLSEIFRNPSLESAAAKEINAIRLLIVCYVYLKEIPSIPTLLEKLDQANERIQYGGHELGDYWILNVEQWHHILTKHEFPVSREWIAEFKLGVKKLVKIPH